MSLSGPIGTRKGVRYGLVLLTALAWVLLYKINAWLFASVEFSSHINWIFLPAALRMVAVMVLGWTGAAGLFTGALFTSAIWSGGNATDELAAAALSALGPMLAVTFCAKFLGLNAKLEGLRAGQVLLFALAGALATALPHNLYFYWSGMQPSLMAGMLPMLVGDLLGTLIVLYGLSAVLRLVSRRHG